MLNYYTGVITYPFFKIRIQMRFLKLIKIGFYDVYRPPSIPHPFWNPTLRLKMHRESLYRFNKLRINLNFIPLELSFSGISSGSHIITKDEYISKFRIFYTSLINVLGINSWIMSIYPVRAFNNFADYDCNNSKGRRRRMFCA